MKNRQKQKVNFNEAFLFFESERKFAGYQMSQ